MTADDIKNNFHAAGTVRWIGLRPSRGAPMKAVQEVRADNESGLVGDRFSGPPGADRQVTFIQQEHLVAVGHLLGRDAIDPALTRRNVVVSGINLQALKGQQFSIGDAILEATGSCPPCSQMEDNLGHGGYNAMRGHGGITAKVVTAGAFRVGDTVEVLAATKHSSATVKSQD